MSAARGLLCFVAIMTCAAGSAESAQDFPASFLVGRYALVGQHPDGGSSYSGTAEIKYEKQKLLLEKRVGSSTTVAVGRIDQASPGEGQVLRFNWDGHQETCLMHSDLDNNARLTCYWTLNGAHHKQPGLEAYFPNGSWP